MTIRGYAAVVLMGLAGCAGPTVKSTGPGPLPVETPVVSAGRAPRHLIVFVPLSDDDAAAWLTWFSRYPRLRMTLALSPRFKTFEKDAALRAQFEKLVEAGRLEIALQLPNPPLLPLLIDTGSARDALPAESPLPEPAYAWPEDIMELIARARADYARIWKTLPKGFVAPYGALSPALIRRLERLGFAWTAAAFGGSDATPAYRSGPLVIWDAAPQTPARMETLVRLWDDRTMRDAVRGRAELERWIRDAESRKSIELVLPSDLSHPAGSMPDHDTWKRRTWTTPDWSRWVGNAASNDAWRRLRMAREALEKFKNSGRASVARLDLAFEELSQAFNAAFYSATASEDLRREFGATLASVYRLIGQPAPEDLFSATPVAETTSGPSAEARVDSATDGRERLTLSDAPEPKGSPAQGSLDLQRLEFLAGPDALDATLTTGGAGDALVDVYIDLNHTPGAGTTSFLPGRRLNAAAADAWEYAVTLSSQQATLYRTQAGGTYEWAATFPVTAEGALRRWSIPRSYLRGNPSRWGFQVLVSSANATPVDWLDPAGVSSEELRQGITTGTRTDLPFVRAGSRHPPRP